MPLALPLPLPFYAFALPAFLWLFVVIFALFLHYFSMAFSGGSGQYQPSAARWQRAGEILYQVVMPIVRSVH